MAMNKKELAYVQGLEKAAREARSLRFTDPVKRDIPVPMSGEKSSGFVSRSNGVEFRVEPAWSGCVFHGTGSFERSARGGASQHGIPLYSTRLLALRGVRNEMERRFAAALAEVDYAIEQELNKEAADHGERQ